MKKNNFFMILLSKKILLLLFLIIIVKTNYSQNIFDYDNSIKFANYLYKSQDFNLAAREFERLAFMIPKVDSIEYKLVKSLRLSNNLDKALNRVEMTYSNNENIPEIIAYEYVKTLILNDNLNKSRIFINNKNKLGKEKLDILSITIELLDNNFNMADSLIKSTRFKNNDFIHHYKIITEEALNIKTKKNCLGVGMSVLVPGSGKVYAGYWKDGLVSSIMFGIAAFQSYRGFKNSGIESGYGWIFGSIGFGFYLGNIYGTNKAINKKNKTIIHRVHTKVQNTFNTSF